MDKLLKGLTVVLGVLALVFGTLYFATPTQVINQNVQPVGSVPVLNSPMEINRHQTFYESKVMTQGTSTPCILKGPTASSTLRYASAKFDTASSAQAILVDIAKTTTANAYASTTLFGASQIITAGAKATIYATTSANNIGITSATQFAPNQVLVVKVAAPEASYNLHNSSTGFQPVGTCNAVWEADN